MRPTKYRAWDTIDKKWMDEDWVLNQPIWMLQATESRYVFVQWTGLTDINNQPIYEGSIFLVETETDTEIFKKEDYPQDDDFTEDYTATTITKYYTILKSDGPLEWYTD